MSWVGARRGGREFIKELEKRAEFEHKWWVKWAIFQKPLSPVCEGFDKVELLGILRGDWSIWTMLRLRTAPDRWEISSQRALCQFDLGGELIKRIDLLSNADGHVAMVLARLEFRVVLLPIKCRSAFWRFLFCAHHLHPPAEKAKVQVGLKKAMPKILQTPVFINGLSQRKCRFSLGTNFIVNEIKNPSSNFTEERCAFYLSSDTEKTGFCWSNRRLCGCSDQSLFWDFVCS
jgi:hypothetical protein